MKKQSVLKFEEIKIRIFDKVKKIMDLNPCLIYENGKFLFKAEQVSEGTYETKEWLNNYIIMKGYIIQGSFLIFEGDILKFKNKNTKEIEYYYVTKGYMYDLRTYIDENFGDNNESYVQYYQFSGRKIDNLPCSYRFFNIIGNVYEYDLNSLKLIEKFWSGE